MQDILNNLRQDIEEIEGSIVSDSATDQNQNQVLLEINRIIKELVMMPTGVNT